MDVKAQRPVGADDRPDAGTRTRGGGWVWPLAVAALPWCWYLLRLIGPSLDLLAVLLPAAAAAGIVVCVAIALVRRRPGFLVSAASVAVLAAVAILLPRTPHPTAAPVDPFLLVSANAFDRNPDPGAAAQALAARRPDVLVTVEVPEGLRGPLAAALPGFAHASRGRLDVYSRWPLRYARRLPGIPKSEAFRVTVVRPGGPFIVVAAHLPNPLHEISFSGHLATVERLVADVRDVRWPVILAGDFNASDRTHAYQALTAAGRDAMRTGWAGSTYAAGAFGLLQLRIDHVVEPATWCSMRAGTFTVPGSDHRGLSVRLGPCPS